MRSRYIVKTLSAGGDCEGLVGELGFKGAKLLGSRLSTFRKAGRRLCLEESAYIDRDFSSAYAAFHATVYKAYTKYCRHLHFLSEAPSDLDNMDGTPKARRPG